MPVSPAITTSTCASCATQFLLRTGVEAGWYSCPCCGAPLQVGVAEPQPSGEVLPPATTDQPHPPKYRYPMLDPTGIQPKPVRVGGEVRKAGDTHWSADFVPNNEGAEHWFEFHGRTTFKHRTVVGDPLEQRHSGVANLRWQPQAGGRNDGGARRVATASGKGGLNPFLKALGWALVFFFHIAAGFTLSFLLLMLFFGLTSLG